MSLPVDIAVPATEAFASGLMEHFEHVRSLLHAAQSRQNLFADRGRRELEFAPGDLVLLNAKHVALRKRTRKAARKLMPALCGSSPCGAAHRRCGISP